MMALKKNDVIDKYVLEDCVGQGGMGEVWRARHTLLPSHLYAIKVMLPELNLMEEYKKRFLREAKTMADLGSHPHIVQVHNVGEFGDGQYYFVMEYAPHSLAEKLGETQPDNGNTLAAGSGDATTQLSIDEAVRIAKEICLGLKAAHEKGVIHRDLKPANILLSDTGSVMIGDFGVAHVKDATNLSVTEQKFGSFAYTDPLVLSGKQKASHLSDIYSVGAILYRMVTGELPQGALEPPKELNPDVPDHINDLIFKCIKRKPEDRPQSVDDVLEALDRQQETAITSQNSDKEHTAPLINNGVKAPEGLESLWDIHQSRLNAMGFSIPKDQELVIRNKKDDGVALWIPPGEFMMGANDLSDEERPMHKVILDGFYMDVNPITIGQYRKFAAETGVDIPTFPVSVSDFDLILEESLFNELFNPFFNPPSEPLRECYPVSGVTWQNANLYSLWSGKKLPSEAQWEYAARGIDGRIYPWGNDDPHDRSGSFDYKIKNIYASPFKTALGKYDHLFDSDSPFGIAHMVANVGQWCLDWFDPNYYSNSPIKNPIQTDIGAGERVFRGANNYEHNAKHLRCDLRHYNGDGGWHSSILGIRCVS